MNFKFTHLAIARADSGSDQAHRGLKSKQARDQQRAILSAYVQIMANAPVAIVTAIFAIIFVVDLEVSWELYRVLVSYMFPQQQPGWAVLSIGLIVAGWTGYVSHLFAKSIQAALFDVEVFHVINLHHNGQYSRTKAEEEVKANQKSEFRQGLLLGSILLILVSLISFQRSWLIAESQGVGETGLGSIVQKILPILLTMLGIVSGIYLQYICWFAKRGFIAWKHDRRFNNCLKQVRQSDVIVNELYTQAQQNGEAIQRTKNLFDSLFRFRSRPIDEGYLDPVPEPFKEVPVKVISEAGTPVSNVTVFGVTANEQLTASYVTLADGSANVCWQDNADYLSQLVVGGYKHFGTYRPHQPTVILFSRLSGQSGHEMLN